MKTKILQPLLLVMIAMTIATLASAADKYVSADLGFAASFPANVVSTQTTPDVANFVASAPLGAWVAQVRVFKNVAMPREITKRVMDAKLAEVLKTGGMIQTGATSYTTVNGHPAVLATATFFIKNEQTQYVSYRAIADMKLVFVQSRSLVEGQNRLYWATGWAVETKDRSGVQPFLDSFELR